MKTLIQSALFACLLVTAPAALADKAAEAEKAEAKLTLKQKQQLKLDEIKLPENPTRAQCTAYVEALRKHVEGRNSFSSGDKEVKKLQALPPEHVDLVLGEMVGSTPLRFYAKYAMRQTDPETYRDVAVQKLADRPNFIMLIVRYGWFEKAKPAILARLEQGNHTDTPATWFQAYTEVAEPKHYNTLHEIAIQSTEPENLIPLLQTLPDYDLNHTISACWQKTKKETSSYTRSRRQRAIAEYAVSIGEIDALGALIDTLQNDHSYHRSQIDQVDKERAQVIRHIAFRGSNKEIKEWFDSNRDKLVFDTFQERFVLKKAFESPEQPAGEQTSVEESDKAPAEAAE